jgi:hypothetical protein
MSDNDDNRLYRIENILINIQDEQRKASIRAKETTLAAVGVTCVVLANSLRIEGNNLAYLFWVGGGIGMFFRYLSPAAKSFWDWLKNN